MISVVKISAIGNGTTHTGLFVQSWGKIIHAGPTNCVVRNVQMQTVRKTLLYAFSVVQRFQIPNRRAEVTLQRTSIKVVDQVKAILTSGRGILPVFDLPQMHSGIGGCAGDSVNVF